MKFILDCLTGADNKTYDLYRVSFSVTLIIYLGLAIWDVYLDHDFKPKDFCEGLGYIYIACASGIYLKSGTEPNGIKDLPPKNKIETL